MLLWNKLKEQASNRADKAAIVCGNTSLTYAEFAAQAENLAQRWLQQGFGPGDAIALHLRNGIELATCYYACFAAGCVAVPVNTRLKPEEIAYVLEDSRAKAYIAERDLRVPSALPALEVSFDPPSAENREILPVSNADEPALLLYTSGTTGHPKGVIHTQRTIAGSVSYLEAWGVTAEDKTLLFTSMMHASGSIMLFISPVFIGSTVTIVPVFDPGTVLDTWERCGATFYMALPTMVRAVLTEQHARPRRITTGRMVICGGDAVPVSLQDDYAATFGHPLVEGFGMTEGLPTLANHPERNCPGSMGRPMGDVELRIVDGEMWMRGSGIAKGYWNIGLFEDGWLKTGDLVEVDAEGFVWFRGRKKEVIVHGGSKISPQEVEDALYQHPAVAEAGAIGEPDSYWGEVVVAFVALRDGHAASVEDLVAFSRTHLAEYKCPEKVVFLPSLPKGPTGKVQRRALKELHLATGGSGR